MIARICDLGHMPYSQAYRIQIGIAEKVKSGEQADTLLFVEHDPVLTLGASFHEENLLFTPNEYRERGIEVVRTDRGGDVTYHGPGQLVGYPILQLGAIRKDVVWYVRMLEEVMIRASAEFGICAVREPGKTGIWVREEEREFTQRAPRTASSQSEERSAAEKLGAIGVHLSRWVTSHGFAYNVSTDLRNFDLIVPCGIAGRKATSLEKLLGRAVQRSEVGPKIASHFGEVFGLELKAGSREELFKKLELAERLIAVPA